MAWYSWLTNLFNPVDPDKPTWENTNKPKQVTPTIKPRAIDSPLSPTRYKPPQPWETAFIKPQVTPVQTPPPISRLSKNNTIAQNEAILTPYFAAYSARYGIPHGILRGICMTESTMGTDAKAWERRANNRASGIMQIIPKWHPGVNTMNPAEAIKYAAQYLREIYNATGSWQLAIAGYNAGAPSIINLARRYGKSWKNYIHTVKGADTRYTAKVNHYAGYAYA